VSLIISFSPFGVFLGFTESSEGYPVNLTYFSEFKDNKTWSPRLYF